jgi:DNA gyrase inhibitor GyrI
MTATADMLSMITGGRYTVGAGTDDNITTSTFETFLEWAEYQATVDGIQSGVYDRAVIYLIADYVERMSASAGRESEKIGDVSYKRASVTQTQWKQMYEEILKTSRKSASSQPSKAQLRADTTMQGVMPDRSGNYVPYDSNDVDITGANLYD